MTGNLTVRDAIEELRTGRATTRSVRCPGHDDGRASLSVSRGSDDKILVHCHAGCELNAVLAAAGLTTSDLFADSPVTRQDAWMPGGGQAIAVYRYVGEDGTHLFDVCRSATKDFRQRRPDATQASGWRWNLDGVRRVLYRLPSVLAAVADAKTIYVCEGEKDVHALEAAGHVATCNPGGAGKWRDEHTAALRGAAKVIVVADRDEPGMRHARQVEAALTAAGVGVLLVEPAQGKDAADHLSAGLGVDAFVPLDRSNAPTSTSPAPDPSPLRRRLTGVGNGERFADEHRGDVHFVHGFSKWYQWDGRRFAPDDMGSMVQRAKLTARGILAEALEATEPEAKRALATHSIRTESERGIREMLALGATEPGIPKRPAEFDADPYLFNVENGTIDLRTGALLPHRRSDLITKLAPIAYDPQATCPTWLAFLDRILGSDAELFGFLWRAIGYSLTGLTVEQVLFLLCGGGQNGKSTLLELLRDLLGEYAQQADPSLFLERKNDSGPRNDVARLQGARMVGAVETAEGQRLAEGLVKQLTGGDTITARYLHQEYFEFKPQAKFWLGTNHRPAVRGTDLAIWRRIRLIPFGVTIPENERDGTLPVKLRAELPGILRWAIDGCALWRHDGLRAPEVVCAATEVYRTEMDVLGAFLDECCTVGSTLNAESGALYDAYTAWCARTGERAASKRAIGLRLQERGFEPFRGTGGVRRWRGLWLTGPDSSDASDAYPRLDTGESTVPSDASDATLRGRAGDSFASGRSSDASTSDSDATRPLLGFSVCTGSREENPNKGSDASPRVTHGYRDSATRVSGDQAEGEIPSCPSCGGAQRRTVRGMYRCPKCSHGHRFAEAS